MKPTYLLAIVMSVAVLPNISAAQNPDNGPVQGNGPNQSNGATRNGSPAQNKAQPQYQNSRPLPSSNAHNRPVYKAGAVVRQVPPNGLPLLFSGISFVFNDGIYYRRFDQGYTVVRPPIGLKIRYMPNGYERIAISGRHYYFYQGIYYAYDNGFYRVVNEPGNSVIYADSPAPLLIQPIEALQISGTQTGFQLGKSYSSLPQGAQSVMVNGQQYFQYADIYFLPQSSGSGVNYIAVKLD